MSNNDKFEDKDLERFFSAWKEKDAQLAVPDFVFKKKSRPRIGRWVPAGVAAATLLTLWLLRPKETEIHLENDVVIITLVEDEHQVQRFVIETKSMLDVWEAPSSSLLTEF